MRFKRGQQVVCVDVLSPCFVSGLTPGKTYEVFDATDFYLSLVDDEGKCGEFYAERFKAKEGCTMKIKLGYFESGEQGFVNSVGEVDVYAVDTKVSPFYQEMDGLCVPTKLVEKKITFVDLPWGRYLVPKDKTMIFSSKLRTDVLNFVNQNSDCDGKVVVVDGKEYILRRKV